MVVDDIIINKVKAIERCIKRIGECFDQKDENVLNDPTRQEAILLNLQRVCENAIDLAMHLIRLKQLGVPQSSRGAFEILSDSGLISRDLMSEMQRMVGFRNIAVHEYHKIDPIIVLAIVKRNLHHFEEFVRAVKKA